MSAVDHGARAHALLSASGSPRWLGCPPSARFEEKFPEQKESDPAAEGTLAHEFAEHMLKLMLKLITVKQYNKETAVLKKHRLYFDGIEELVEKYVNYVYEEYLHQKTVKIGKVEIFIEQKFDLSKWIEESFGTNDSSIYSIDLLEIVDAKFGRNEVVAKDNPQLKIYALGALEALGAEKAASVTTIKLTIVQPRLDAISTWTISKEELLEWAEKELKPKAELAFKGKGEFAAGDHCFYCRAKAQCTVKFDSVLKSAELDFMIDEGVEVPEVLLLSDEELVKVFAATKDVTDYFKAVYDHLFDRVRKGEAIEGLKMVTGRTSRTFVKEEELIELLEMYGYEEEDTHTKSLKGITAMEKLVGKNNIDKLLGGFIALKGGAPQLALAESKKQAIGIQSAVDDFAEPIE